MEFDSVVFQRKQKPSITLAVFYPLRDRPLPGLLLILIKAFDSSLVEYLGRSVEADRIRPFFRQMWAHGL